MELRQLKSFVTVAKLLSFNRAAGSLNYAQSTVSTQIRALEEEFGKPLFDRLGKTIVLTEAGRVLMRYAQRMLSMAAETHTQVAGWEEVQATVTIRAPQSLSTFIFPPVIRQFQARYPKVGIDISNCALTVQQELRSGIIDLAFLLSDGVSERDLIADVLGVATLVLVAAPDHSLTQLPSVTLKDLGCHTMLLPSQDCSYKMLMEKMLGEENVAPAAVVTINSLAALKNCVAAGVGVMLIPEMAIRKELRAGTLWRLPWTEPELETAILMIRHKDRWLSPHVEAFMQMVKAQLA